MKLTTILRIVGGVLFFIALVIGGRYKLGSLYYLFVVFLVASYELLLVREVSADKRVGIGPLQRQQRHGEAGISDKVKIAAIVSVAIVAAVGVYVYFSPYQSCVRGYEADGSSPSGAALMCSRNLGGRGQ